MKKWIVTLIALTMLMTCALAQAETLRVGME